LIYVNHRALGRPLICIKASNISFINLSSMDPIQTHDAAPSPALPPSARSSGRLQHARRYLMFVALLLLAAAGGAAWWRIRATPSVHCTTAPITRGTIARSVTATGTVNPILTIIVGSYVSGVIQSLSCDYNTVVKAGQICAKVDPRPYQATFDQYAGQLLRDQAILGKDRTNLARYQKLAAQNSIARQRGDRMATTSRARGEPL
jgi:multidrug efflux pump subunit AcrA (membrane-fusion protein)